MEYISVKDSLPKNPGIYNVIRAYSNISEPAEFICGCFTNYQGYKVTHWMPLPPKPPKD